jgi:hypothetical protein
MLMSANLNSSCFFLGSWMLELIACAQRASSRASMPTSCLGVAAWDGWELFGLLVVSLLCWYCARSSMSFSS